MEFEQSILNKEFSLKFRVSTRVRRKTPEKKKRRMHWPKRREYDNENEDNSPNTQNDKNYQASTKKIRQIISYLRWLRNVC